MKYTFSRRKCNGSDNSNRNHIFIPGMVTRWKIKSARQSGRFFNWREYHL